MREALPCVRCRKQLQNVTDDVTNQPDDGLTFQSEGHYGSTTFDPMDGHYVEINVCDSCVLELARAGRVLLGRTRKPVVSFIDDATVPTLVGWTAARRELVPWDGTHPGDDPLVVEPDEIALDLNVLGEPVYPEIEWLPIIKKRYES